MNAMHTRTRIARLLLLLFSATVTPPRSGLGAPPATVSTHVFSSAVAARLVSWFPSSTPDAFRAAAIDSAGMPLVALRIADCTIGRDDVCSLSRSKIFETIRAVIANADPVVASQLFLEN